MEPENKKGKYLAIGIGLILAVLLVYIGFRIVQNSSTRASVSNLTCERLTENSVQAVATTETDVAVLFIYDSTFFARPDASEVQAQADGTYRQVKVLDNVSSGTVTVEVEGVQGLEATCPAYTAGAGATDGSSADIIPDTSSEAANEPAPTFTVGTGTTTDIVKTELTVEEATAYYESNSGATRQDCLAEFGETHTGLGYACNQGYLQAN